MSPAATSGTPTTTVPQAKKEVRRSLAEQNALGDSAGRKGHVVENTDEKIVVQFPWQLRAVGFYDGMITNTDLQIDYKTGDNQVTVWLKKARS